MQILSKMGPEIYTGRPIMPQAWQNRDTSSVAECLQVYYFNLYIFVITVKNINFVLQYQGQCCAIKRTNAVQNLNNAVSLHRKRRIRTPKRRDLPRSVTYYTHPNYTASATQSAYNGFIQPNYIYSTMHLLPNCISTSTFSDHEVRNNGLSHEGTLLQCMRDKRYSKNHQKRAIMPYVKHYEQHTSNPVLQCYTPGRNQAIAEIVDRPQATATITSNTNEFHENPIIYEVVIPPSPIMLNQNASLTFYS